MDNARKAALGALDMIEKDGAYTNIVLDNLFRAGDYSAVDRRFISALTYGVTERKLTLDYLISRHIKKGAKKLPATVKNALRMAAYQILFMDKVPDFAAVNESVRLVKASKHAYLSGLVNAVLHKLISSDNTLPADDSIKSLSVRYSCGEEIIKDLIKDYGAKAAKAFLENALCPPPVYIRVNTLKTSEDELISLFEEKGVICEKTVLSGALILKNGADITESEEYKNGLFHIEDMSCQTAVSVLSPKSGERVLDACSAPGGKAFTMAQLMNNKGRITALDIYPARVELIEAGAARLGINNITTAVADSSVYRNAGQFDAVLCDVPCSGTGVIRRKPEIKYRAISADGTLYKTQADILLASSRQLKAGGRLLYSTCSLCRRENGDTVAAFLAKNDGFSLEYEHTFMPQTDGGDGFYCALIRKNR